MKIPNLNDDDLEELGIDSTVRRKYLSKNPQGIPVTRDGLSLLSYGDLQYVLLALSYGGDACGGYLRGRGYFCWHCTATNKQQTIDAILLLLTGDV